MTDKELLYIKTIADEKNITRAAQKLHIAQPSLTQCIQRIEKSMGRPLFYRQKSGLVLTDAGELYYQTACEILNVWEHFSQELKKLNELKGGTLSIGASWYHTLMVLTKILPIYSQRYPHVEVCLTEKNTEELERLLSLGEVDIILTHQYPEEFPTHKRADSKKLVCRSLFKEPFCLVVPARFQIEPESENIEESDRADTEFPLADLKKFAHVPFIRFRENQRIRHISDFILDQAGIMPVSAVSTYGFPGALELAKQGMGAIFLPQFYVQSIKPDAQNISVYRIPDRYSAYWTVGVCYYQSDYMPVTVESFLETLAETKNFGEISNDLAAIE